MEYRDKNNILRNDFIDLMRELKNKDDKNEFNNEDITAHAAGFIGDGFETSSIVMSYLIYEIARNIDVQNRLRDEIDEMASKNNGKITFENVQEFKYLDCVINGIYNMRKRFV